MWQLKQQNGFLDQFMCLIKTGGKQQWFKKVDLENIKRLQ
jgi:hypothetical protein